MQGLFGVSLCGWACGCGCVVHDSRVALCRTRTRYRGVGLSLLPLELCMPRVFQDPTLVNAYDSLPLLLRPMLPLRPMLLQMELCKKDLDYVGRAEQDAAKDVKKTPNMKLPIHFYSTFEKVGQNSSIVLTVVVEVWRLYVCVGGWGALQVLMPSLGAGNMAAWLKAGGCATGDACMHRRFLLTLTPILTLRLLPPVTARVSSLSPTPKHPTPRTHQVKELLGANKPVRDAEWTAKEVRAAAAAAGICSSGLSCVYQLLHAHTQLPGPFPVLRPNCCLKICSASVRATESLALIFLPSAPHQTPPKPPTKLHQTPIRSSSSWRRCQTC